jgi:hypothetical protein
MNLRLLATPLLSTIFLLGTLGCSKKDDPASPAVSMGSYKLDGKTITCQVTAKGGYSTGSGHSGMDYDFMGITLKTIPEPTSGAETLEMNFARPNATTNYALSYFSFFTKGHYNADALFDINITGTLTVNRDGTVSGTFAAQTDPNGSSSNNGYPLYKSITAGSFTNVHP